MAGKRSRIPKYGTVEIKGHTYYRTTITDSEGKQRTLYGSTDKLGLTDAVGRKAGGKIGVFFLSHTGLDHAAAVGRVVLFAGHGIHFLSLGFVKILVSNASAFSDCLTFSALALRPQFTDAAFHRMVCDGCYHARTIPDGE